MNLFTLALDLQRIAPRAAKTLTARAVPWMIPFTGGLGLGVEESSKERVVLTLPLKRRTRNHVGSVYFGAQVTLAEICMGLLLFNRYPPGPYGLLVKRAEVDFHAKAKSALRATCDPGSEIFATLEQGLAAEGKAEAWIEVPLRDQQGAIVTTPRFLVALRDFRSKAA